MHQEQAVTYTAADKEIRMGAWESELPADIILAIDQSGSMSKGRLPTDPSGLRVKGSCSFLEFIAGRSSKSLPNRFGVVNFGTEAPRRYAVPLTRIDSIDDPIIRRIRAHIIPLNLESTSFISALRSAVQLLREGGSFEEARNRSIVVFTDGEPDDSRKLTLPQYFAELKKFVEREAKPDRVDIFIIGIDASGKRWSATVPYWRRLVGTDRVFTTPDMPALKAQFNRIVQRVWHLPEVEPVVVSSRSPVEFEVEPYLAAVEIHIFPGRKGLSLRIHRPDGKPVRPGQDGDTPPVKHLSTFDRIIIYEPEPGRWRYEVTGGAGSVEILRNPIPLRMRLISPAPVHPQGKPMRLIAEFRRADGKPVVSHRDYPLGLTADVIAPTGKKTPVKFPLEPGRNGFYRGEPAVEAPMDAGEYQVVLKVSGGEKYHTENPMRVKVEPIPYLLVDEPSENIPVPPASSFPIRVRLLQAGKPLRPQDAFSNHPDNLIIAQVMESPEGQRGKAVWLNLAKEAEPAGQFVGPVPAPAPGEGRYVLAFKLAPEEAKKQKVADQTMLEVMARRPATPGWKNALWTSMGALMIGGVVLMLWLVSLPPMDCDSAEIYPITGDGEGEPRIVFLSNRKFACARVPAYEKVKSRFFFFNGHKGEQQPVTIRWVTFLLPHMRVAGVGSDATVGHHRIEIH